MHEKVNHRSSTIYAENTPINPIFLDSELIHFVLEKVTLFKKLNYCIENLSQNHGVAHIHNLAVEGMPLMVRNGIKKIVEYLCEHSGFVVLRHFPIDLLPENDQLAFLIFTSLLGIPSYANRDKKLIWPVINRQIKASNNQSGEEQIRFGNSGRGLKFHTDTSTLAALLCVTPADEGGENELISTVMLHNELIEKHPEIMDILYSPVYIDRRGEQPQDGKPYAYLPVFGIGKNGELKTHWAADYHHTVFENTSCGLDKMPATLSDAYQKLEAHIDVLAQKAKIIVKLTVGDMLIVNNNLCLHNRTAYQGSTRELLRSWIYTPQYETFEHMFGYPYL